MSAKTTLANKIVYIEKGRSGVWIRAGLPGAKSSARAINTIRQTLPVASHFFPNFGV